MRERLLEAHIWHLEAEPQYSCSQVEPGNEIEIREVPGQGICWLTGFDELGGGEPIYLRE